MGHTARESSAGRLACLRAHARARALVTGASAASAAANANGSATDAANASAAAGTAAANTDHCRAVHLVRSGLVPVSGLGRRSSA